MKRIWIRAGETIHIEGLPCRVAEDAAVDCNPHNLKMLEHVRYTEHAPRPEEMRSAIIDECIAAVRGESLEEPAQTDGDEGYMNAIEWSITALMELRAKRTEPQKSEGS